MCSRKSSWLKLAVAAVVKILEKMLVNEAHFFIELVRCGIFFQEF